MRFDAKQLRITKPTEEQLSGIVRKSIYIILDDVLDTYNIGSIFRLADAVSASEVILCAGSETPPSTRIHKAAIGTEEWVPWKYYSTALEAIKDLRERIPGIEVIAVEQDVRAVELTVGGDQLTAGGPIAIVVGHETKGVSKEVLDIVDKIIEIPMWGVNKSLNVHVSAAVVIYRLVV